MRTSVPLLLAFVVVGARVAAAEPFAYVTNLSSGTVSVLDTATDTVTATITVGSGPYGVALDAAGGRLYVTNNHGAPNSTKTA